MANSPVLIATFAANDLVNVHVEAEKIWQTVENNPAVKAIKIEDADIATLTSNILKHHKDLYFFHFGGHAEQKKVILEGLRDLDKIRLARMLMPKEDHKLQWVFLNGCLSYGHVGLLTAKGAKAIIATNVEISDAEAAQLASIFYQCFFEQDFSLKEAFEFAETTVAGRNAHVVLVNPGEIDEDQAMPSSWTLFVNAKFKEVLDWTLEDFITKGPKATEELRKTEQGAGNINKADVKGNNNQVFQGISGSEININTGAAQKADKIYNIDKIDKADFS